MRINEYKNHSTAIIKLNSFYQVNKSELRKMPTLFALFVIWCILCYGGDIFVKMWSLFFHTFINL